MIGPGHEGHSEYTHYKFIDKYRTSNISRITHQQYVEELKYSPENQQKINEWSEFEGTSIHLKMLIYLKFWEADSIIKMLYQFARIINGESYDWYFKIGKNFTGIRQNILRNKFRDRIKQLSPSLSEIIDNTFKPQIRNSIAHSNYSLLGRTIHLNNASKLDDLRVLQFDEWIDTFHNTLVIHSCLIKMKNSVGEYYAKEAEKNNNSFRILITEAEGRKYELDLIYRKEFYSWHYKQPE